MFNYSKDGITVSSVLDNRRPTKGENFPIKIRVTYKRVRQYYKTGKNLTINEWEKLGTSKSKRLIEIKEDIENSFSIIKSYVEQLAKEDDFSFSSLNIRLGRLGGDTLNGMFRTKIEILQQEERIGTMSFYDNVLKGVERFAGISIAVDNVTVDWLSRYEKHLLGENKSYTTVGMHMRAIRAIINEAKKVGAIKASHYPFGKGKYEIKRSEGRKKALTLEQIKRIVDYSDVANSTERYKDLWIFMYLCNGINVADLIKLKFRNIIDGEVCFIRQKTERTAQTIKEIQAIITPQMQVIISKWGNEAIPDNYIFPFLKGNESALDRKKKTQDITRRINRKMKQVGDELGIPNISTYTARHSFATVLKRSGANIAYISESLGHSDLKTTENYLASFEKEERMKNAELLLNF